MYTFKDSDGKNIQTARLGVDYACDKQLFNHIPGASAFCRKDYLQMYLLDYISRYERLDLHHCYEPITPKSYLLMNPEQCNNFLKEIEIILNNYNRTSMPLE